MNIEFPKAIIPDEIPALLDFDRRAFQAYQSDIFPPEEWKKYDSYWMIVDGEIIGCAALEALRKDYLWIASTAILPEYRNHEFGTRLKQWEIDYAKSHGFSRIGTMMRQSNEAIIRLNEKFGFKSVPTQHRYPTPDEPGLKMELQLPLPVCPQCGKTLRTHRAKQCRFCKVAWHQ